MNRSQKTEILHYDRKRAPSAEALRSLTFVIENGLCTGCGTCSGICPNDAIKMSKDKKQGIYLPKIDYQKCTDCGLCSKSCPGYKVDFKELNLEIFRKIPPPTIEGSLLGNYLKCYAGYSTDHEVRYKSASGGLITQLLLFMLDEGIIDGALVTGMGKENPLEPKPFIARTREEIINASGSKYCPVPVNVALKYILRQKGKYAVVGLPCHIHGLRKAEQVIKKLKERIVLHMGIFCSHTDTFLETEYLLYRFNIKSKDVSKIAYRGKGWPGMLTIKSKRGNEVNVPFHEWIKAHAYCMFAPSRCLLCCDHSAELSDISFADAWLPEFQGDKIGTSLIISRTKVGEEILRKAVANKKIEIREIDCIKVAESQKMMRFKKNSLAVRFLFFKAASKKIPIYNRRLLKPSLIDFPRSGIIFVNRYIASKRSLWRFLEKFINLQSPLEKMYTKVLGSSPSKSERTPAVSKVSSRKESANSAYKEVN